MEPDSFLSGDARGAHTRRRLARSYIALLSEGPVRSAADVAEHAGVNRSSLYAHFPSVSDLARHALRAELDPPHQDNLSRIEQGTASPLESNQLVIQKIVEMAASTSGALTALLRNDRAFGEWVFGEILNEYVRDYFHLVGSFSSVPDPRRAVTEAFLGHALSGVICAWLCDEMPLDTRDLEALLVGLVPGWVLDPSAIGVPL